MGQTHLTRYLRQTRYLSVCAPIISGLTCFVIVIFLSKHIHIASVIGTTAAATIAACATYARMHTRTQRYVRFAIRARLATKAEPQYDRLMRQLSTRLPSRNSSAHPSPEITDALREAEKCMGMRSGSVLALVVPLELILGVPHSCPSAAAMLYANRHPVILIDDHLQALLDQPEDIEQNHDLVVSVMCHELAHLVGWNTRWSKLVNIFELFVTTASMAALVAYGLEHNFYFGITGVVIASIHLASEPALINETTRINIYAIIARLALVAWIPYVITGIAIRVLPVGLTLGVTFFTLGLRFVLATIRRKQEMYADALAVHALGNPDSLIRFFRGLASNDYTLWQKLFSTHPPIQKRMKALRKAI